MNRNVSMNRNVLESLCREWMINDAQFTRHPLVHDFDLHIKLEGFNPAGSIKLKTALGLVADIESRYDIGTDTTFIESSSGNLGIALSAVCARKNYQFTCVVDPNTPSASIDLMNAFGATVEMVVKEDEAGGYLRSRIDYIQDRLSNNRNLIWFDQYSNHAGPEAHERLTARAIYKRFPEVDYLFIGTGTTGTLMGCIRFFSNINHPVRIVGVDPTGSVTFGGPAGKRRLPGLGTSVSPSICDASIVKEVVSVNELDAIVQCRSLARYTGLALGGSTGMVLAGFEQCKSRIPSGATVVVISPDGAERYLDTIYSDEWVAKHFPNALST